MQTYNDIHSKNAVFVERTGAAVQGIAFVKGTVRIKLEKNSPAHCKSDKGESNLAFGSYNITVPIIQ